VSEAARPRQRVPETLVARYDRDDLHIFTGAERDRFLGHLGSDALAALSGDESAWTRVAPHVAWELLYRKEPELYERLVAGERIHPSILDWFPPATERCVEVAAGSGRLTVDLAPRCRQFVAVEPAKPLRQRLGSKLDRRGLRHVVRRDGFFDAIPVDDDWADVVVTLSAFTPEESHGGDAGLRELERVAKRGGLIVVVWPSDVGWLADRGFEHVVFPGDMAVEFASVGEAIALARIFYPEAAAEIERRASPIVPYELLEMNPPRDLAWRRCE
jgi:SAM-dependent methyltransferase